MSDFKEIEFKYYAHDIPRKKFDKVITGLPEGTIKGDLMLLAEADNGKHSIDHYFTAPDSARFMRWREGQDKNNNKSWELTSKYKMTEKNNNVRSEVNIPVNAKDMNIKKAKEFSSHHGLEYDFSIKKDVQIYWMNDPVVLSHYTTFDMEGNVLHTFMEIEADEKHEWESEEQALEVISSWEKKLSDLGITAQNRIKRSLFEFYTGKIKQGEKIKELL